MAVPAKRAKSIGIYKADDGTNFAKELVDDRLAFGLFPSGTGQPFPSHGRLKPRHLTVRTPDGSRKFTLDIATRGGFDSFTLGDTTSYGGISVIVVGKHGEASSLR